MVNQGMKMDNLDFMLKNLWNFQQLPHDQIVME